MRMKLCGIALIRKAEAMELEEFLNAVRKGKVSASELNEMTWAVSESTLRTDRIV